LNFVKPDDLLDLDLKWHTQDFIMEVSTARAVLLRPDEPKVEVRFLGRGSHLSPHQLGSLGSAVSSPAGFWAVLRPPSGFAIAKCTR